MKPFGNMCHTQPLKNPRKNHVIFSLCEAFTVTELLNRMAIFTARSEAASNGIPPSLVPTSRLNLLEEIKTLCLRHVEHEQRLLLSLIEEKLMKNFHKNSCSMMNEYSSFTCRILSITSYLGTTTDFFKFFSSFFEWGYVPEKLSDKARLRCFRLWFEYPNDQLGSKAIIYSSDGSSSAFFHQG